MEAIKVDNVHKNFKVYYDKGSTLKERLMFKNRNRHEVHNILKGISISIKKGEVVGLIGENGCGKSTLLKLMTKIIYPDKGTIQLNGKVSSLLELGAGFHPDMTGRENIYMNASIFGLTKREIDNRLEKIIEFSELGGFIDNPVRTYSSGMYMRLAFSVAINVDAEILLVDEILAVGDANFQIKCFNKMQEVKREGKTIVIVSHDMSSIERLCDRTIWIKNGVIAKEGFPRDVSFDYLEYIMNKKSNPKLDKEHPGEVSEDNYGEKLDKGENTKDNKIDEQLKKEKSNQRIKKRWGNKDIEIKSISLLDCKGKKITKFKTGDKILISIDFKNNKSIDEFVTGIAVTRNDGLSVYGTNMRIDGVKLDFCSPKEGNIKFEFKAANFILGKYYLDVALEDLAGTPYDFCRNVLEFEVYSSISDIGVARFDHDWYVNNKKLTVYEGGHKNVIAK